MLKKPFLRPLTPLQKPSVFRIVISLLIGLLFAIAFYALLYFTREFFRFFSLTSQYELWLLSDQAHNFYNLFFAFVAVVFGQSFFFLLLFHRPAIFLAKRQVMRHSIVNDQRSLNWFFISWFGQLAVIYGLFFGYVMKGGFYEFSFYPGYAYLFVLIAIVFFLHPWITIRRLWPTISLKWIAVSLLVVSMLSFGLSKLQLLNHKQLESTLMSKDIHANYQLELPESVVFRKPEKHSLTEKVYYVYGKNDSLLEKPLIIANHAVMTLDSLIDTVNAWSSQRPEADQNFMTWLLYIHREISMEQVYALKKSLKTAGHRRIGYAVNPKNSGASYHHLSSYYFVQIIPSGYAQSGWIDSIQTFLDTVPVYINLHVSAEDQLSINGEVVKMDSMHQQLRALIHPKPNVTFLLHVDSMATFGNYITVLSTIQEGINNWRNDYALQTYGMSIDRLSMDKYLQLRSKTNYRVLEYVGESFPFF